MANIPRFLIAQNLKDQPGYEYIIHTQQPVFIARRIYGNPLSDFEITEIDNIANFYGQNVSKIAQLMRQLGDWYANYNNVK